MCKQIYSSISSHEHFFLIDFILYLCRSGWFRISMEIHFVTHCHVVTFIKQTSSLSRHRYTSFKQNKEASISEIHDFVKKLPTLTLDYTSLDQHVNIAEHIKEITEQRDFRGQWQIERLLFIGHLFLIIMNIFLYL
jgi:hypothetical protein